MLIVDKVIKNLSKITKQLEQVTEENLKIVDNKYKTVEYLEIEIDACLEESRRAEKIRKKFEELLEL